MGLRYAYAFVQNMTNVGYCKNVNFPVTAAAVKQKRLCC